MNSAIIVSATENVLKSALSAATLRLEAEIETAKSDVIKWMFGIIGFQTLVIVGAIVALARIIKP